MGLLLYLTSIVMLGMLLWIGVRVFQNREYTLLSLKEKTVNEKRIYQLVENSKDIIYYFDVVEFRFKYLSPSIDVFFGAGHLKECMEDPLLAFRNLHPDDVHIVNDKISGNLDYSKPIIQRWKDPSGSFLWFEEYSTPIYNEDELIGVQGIIRNVDEKVKLQKELEFQIYHDSLTGIYNRSFFDDRMARFNKIAESVGIILCDLDNLKVTNDTYGHKAGDQLIKETANVLHVIENDHAAVSRIGGDEFAILLNRMTYQDVQAIASKVAQMVDEYNESCGGHPISLSLGLAYRSSSIGQMVEMFQEADQNMYEHKNGKREVTPRGLTLLMDNHPPYVDG